MATNTSPTNGSGVNNVIDLAQKRIYMGEVLSAFTTNTIMKNHVHVKTIQSGISGRFPVTNTGNADEIKQHTAGDVITANKLEVGERVITLDPLLYDAKFIDQADGKTLDFDITSPVTKSIGVTLAQKLDQDLIGMLKEAVKTTGIAGQKDGEWVFNTDITNGTLTREERGNAHIDALLDASLVMDENDVPADNRIYVTTPEHFLAMGQASKVRNKDFQVKNGGIDVYSYEVLWIANIMVIKSNNLTKGLAKRPNGAEGFVGFLFTNECIGLLQFIDVITEVNYEYSQFGTWFTGRYKCGMGVLNPTLCVGVRNTDTALS